MRRREMLKAAVAATGGLAAASLMRPAKARDFLKPDAAAKGLTVYQKDDSILIRFDNLPVIAYRAQPSLKYPYFCPLNGPVSGLSLTTESAIPYPHHRGLWLGCDPVNGGNYWADNGLEAGQIRSTRLDVDKTRTTSNEVVFTQACSWERQSSHPFTDERTVRIMVEPGRRTLIDCGFRLTAVEDVSIKSAKHSLFAMRAAADISPTYGGTLINSAGGTGAKGTYGKMADWCGYFGKRRLRPDVTEGIVIMNHPANFGGGCPWFTRDYGHLSPSPFNFLPKPWTLARGESLELRYRVVLFAGTPKHAGLDGLYRSWVAS